MPGPASDVRKSDGGQAPIEDRWFQQSGLWTCGFRKGHLGSGDCNEFLSGQLYKPSIFALLVALVQEMGIALSPTFVMPSVAFDGKFRNARNAEMRSSSNASKD